MCSELRTPIHFEMVNTMLMPIAFKQLRWLVTIQYDKECDIHVGMFTVCSAKCPSAKCPFGEMFIRTNVTSVKRPFGQVSVCQMSGSRLMWALACNNPSEEMVTVCQARGLQTVWSKKDITWNTKEPNLGTRLWR